MPDRSDPESLFLANLSYIERVATKACARSGVPEEDVSDCISFITEQLIKNDYSAIRKFQDRASLRTYLTAIVTRQCIEYQRKRGGRWRPSAAALRAGPPAPELERLVCRQGYTLRQAGEKLRTAGLTTKSDTELARLLGDFTERAPLRPVPTWDERVLDAVPSLSSAEEHVQDAEDKAERIRIYDALNEAMSELPPDDAVMARMRFVSGYKIKDIARALGLEPKPLYRRLERISALLRKSLEERGVHSDHVLDLIEGAEDE